TGISYDSTHRHKLYNRFSDPFITRIGLDLPNSRYQEKPARSEVKCVQDFTPAWLNWPEFTCAGMLVLHGKLTCSILGTVSANLKKHLATLSKRGKIGRASCRGRVG